MKEVLSLKKYIETNFKTQSNFANHIGKTKQRVNEMINNGYIVVKDENNLDVIYSERCELSNRL